MSNDYLQTTIELKNVYPYFAFLTFFDVGISNKISCLHLFLVSTKAPLPAFFARVSLLLSLKISSLFVLSSSLSCLLLLLLIGSKARHVGW